MNLKIDADSNCPLDVNNSNFKSSPNFKNMKKFLKNRSHTPADANVSLLLAESTLQEEVRPPLPVEPPPQDEYSSDNNSSSPGQDYYSPAMLLTTPKQERSSPEPDMKYDDAASDFVQEESKVETANVKPICKDFIRGTCSRFGCKYRHEIDLTQLKGILMFCHDYQNRVCNKPNCKYVHGTVFEEQKFYRTGELPKVLRQKNQAPSAVPAPEPASETKPDKEEESFHFKVPNCPPPFVANLQSEHPPFVTKPNQMIFNDNAAVDSTSSRPSNKINWLGADDGNFDVFASLSPQNENRVKRCGSCSIMDNRLKFAMQRLNEVRKSAEKSERKMVQLEKKHKFLLYIASILTSAQLNERENPNVNRSPTSIFGHIDLQQAVQQSAAMVDQLSELKRMTSQQGTNFSAQQSQQLFNINNSVDDNNSKVFEMQPSRQLLIF